MEKQKDGLIMELLQENIIWLVKQFKSISFELNMVKAMKVVLWMFTIVIAIAICILVYLFVVSIQINALGDAIAGFILMCMYIWWIWYMHPLISKEYNKDIAQLEAKKEECEIGIRKYKNDIIDLREMEKKMMKSKTKLTENQTETLNIYAEKAKHYFKWLVVTKDGEVVASDMKPDYDEDWNTWFYNNEATCVQVGKNKKLSKHSKFTLTEIK